VTVTGATRAWIGNGECAPTKVSGPVKISGSTGQVTVDHATIGGPLVVQNNTGPTLISANHINGPLSCSGNSPTPTNAGQPNTTSGPKSGQCAVL
jgi:hexosaminidase